MTARYEKLSTADEKLANEEDSVGSEEAEERAQIDFDDYDEDNDSGKLKAWTAVLFIVGNVVGAGVISMPYCMKLAGWAALPLILICSVSFVYAGILLAKSCSDVIQASSKKSTMRDIYPSVAETAGGKVGRNIVTVLMTITLVSACLIFMLVAGELLQKLFPIFGNSVSSNNTLRFWFLICGVLLLPLTFLGSPKDFWAVALVAMATSGIATIAIIINLGIARHESKEAVTHTSASVKSVFAAIGIVSFGFSGSTIFPTIQNDLKDPKEFYKSVFLGYAIVTFVYILVPVLAYVVLGNNIKEDILSSFMELPVHKTSPVFRTLVTVSQLCICIHVLCALVMNVNPVYLQLEAHLNIPMEFCWQRVAVRCCGMLILLCVAIAIPRFGPVLSLAGGTVQILIGLVAPVLIYALLSPLLPKWLVAIFIGIFIMCIVLVSGSAFVEMGNIIKVIKGTYKP